MIKNWIDDVRALILSKAFFQHFLPIKLSKQAPTANIKNSTYYFDKLQYKVIPNTVMHDFNGHEVNGIHGLYGKKVYDEALFH